MKLHQAAIGVIIITMVFLGISAYIGDLGDKYGVTADYTDAEGNITYNAISSLHSEMQNQSSNLAGVILAEEGGGTFANPYKLIKAGIGSVKIMIVSWFTLGNMATDLIKNSPIAIEPWVTVSITAMVAILVTALLIYGFVKWKFED